MLLRGPALPGRFFSGAQGGQDLREIPGERRLRRHVPAGLRVREAEFSGVQHLPGSRERGAFHDLPAVDSVTQDRVARRREVNADLVRASRLGAHRDHRRVREPLERPVSRDRPAALLPGPGDRAAQPRLPDEVRVQRSGVPGMPLDQGHVLALDRVLAKARLEGVERRAAAREHDRPRRVLVEAVDDARVGAAGVPVLEVVEGAAPEGVLFPRLGRDRQESRGLVHDEHVAVLVKHGEPRPDVPPHGAVPLKHETDVRLDGRARLVDDGAVDLDAAGPHGVARRSPRQGESDGDGLVQPHGLVSRGTRTSTKKPGSPMRAPGPPPGP